MQYVHFIALEALSVHHKKPLLSEQGTKLHIHREFWENSFSQYACQLDYLKICDHKVLKRISSSGAEISPHCHTQGKFPFMCKGDE